MNSSSLDGHSCVGSPTSTTPAVSGSSEGSKLDQIKKFGRKGTTFACRINDHVKLGSKFSETVKGKLKLGGKIIKEGGRENIFKHIFGVRQGEELLKASQCYLSTTAGPIAGLLFISTHKVAFCSQNSVTFQSSNGECIETSYKVVIPVNKIKRANQRENAKKPARKFIEIVTKDNFEFWFMGFLRYEKAFMNLEKVISMAY